MGEMVAADPTQQGMEVVQSVRALEDYVKSNRILN